MKTITSIASFEKISEKGSERYKETIYELSLVCGCRERHGYIDDLEPQIGGWAECSCGIVDNYTGTLEFYTDAGRAELKRALHDASNHSMQIALSALLYAYRHQKARNEEMRQRIPTRRPPYPRPRWGATQ